MLLNSIHGLLTEKHASGFACCQVNGIEWLLAMSRQSLNDLPAVGSSVCIYTRLKVSEHQIQLYGFSNKTERDLFDILITVPGIGPKLVLGILSKAPSENIMHLIIHKDERQLSKLPGIGLKTAQKLILQLSTKLEKKLLQTHQSQEPQPSQIPTQEADQYKINKHLQQRQVFLDLHQALVTMGYDSQQSTNVLESVFHSFASEQKEAMPLEGECLHLAILALSKEAKKS